MKSGKRLLYGQDRRKMETGHHLSDSQRSKPVRSSSSGDGRHQQTDVTRQLHELEEDKILQREVFPEVPPRAGVQFYGLREISVPYYRCYDKMGKQKYGDFLRLTGFPI